MSRTLGQHDVRNPARLSGAVVGDETDAATEAMATYFWFDFRSSDLTHSGKEDAVCIHF